MKKKIKIIIVSFLIILCFTSFFLYSNKKELRAITSDKQLLKIYNGDSDIPKTLINFVAMPFSVIINGTFDRGGIVYDSMAEISSSSTNSYDTSSSGLEFSSKDYSTTNIQVENVDEADITKTDGDYIYSISNDNVIITNVMNPQEVKIEATIGKTDNAYPEDLILYKNKLVVISEKEETNYVNTVVRIYNIDDKTKPNLIKSYELYEPYYTSRCIDNKLYIISSGYLRKEDVKDDKSKIERRYSEDNEDKEIALEDIKYLKDVDTRSQTLIAFANLDEESINLDVKSYLLDISNAYVSEKSIYLLNQDGSYDDDSITIKTLYGLKGIIGFFEKINNYNYSYDINTEIYKFDILEDGEISYKSKNKIEGRTINQYSLDEQNGHLRVALYDNDGARVAVFDENLNKIGISNYVAKGEKMYSSRFMGNKAYLVTYKTMDPLFVIDLSNEENPKVLGELNIPGYSTYLHPYDENHLIGIGMETKEVINKDLYGRVTSTSSRIIGMKMALFDVTDVNNPIQISQTVIGDSRTSSAILTNPKALLFSKEKQLIAIPVNNYEDDFGVVASNDSYSSTIDSYKNYNKPCVAEGYFVYNINLETGFNLKGIITHEKDVNTSKHYYYNKTKLLRGLYIEDNLYTVSESAIKVNKLDTLELVSELKIDNNGGN